VGDVEVKRKLATALNDFLDPIRERRAEYERQPSLLEDILAEGSRRARAESCCPYPATMASPHRCRPRRPR